MANKKGNQLQELVKAAVTSKRASEVDLLDAPSFLLPGLTANRNASLAAYQATVKLLLSLVDGPDSYSCGVFVQGVGAEEFAAKAAIDVPALVLDASELYTKVAAAWFPTVRVDRVFAVDQVGPLLDALSQVTQQLGVAWMSRPEFGQHFGHPVVSLEDAVAVTRELLRGAVGDGLNVMFLNQRLVDELVREAWCLPLVPTVFLNATDEEVTAEGGLASAIFRGRTTLETVEEGVIGGEVVTAAFRRLREKVLGKKSE